MKRYILTMLLAIAAVLAHADNSLWKAYMAYHDITRIEQGGKRLYVLASGNLFTYNTADGEVRTFDKCNGLSDCAISHIAWCQQAARLVIVYSNQNIDLMSGRNNDDITNLPDYYRKSMTEDKTINHVCIDGVYAYLSTGFGIVKVNVKNAEVSETYNLHTPVAYSYVEGGYLYAAQRGKGIYRAALGTNMMDPANWTYARAYSDIWETPDSKLLDMVKDLDRGGLKYNNFGCLRFYNGRLYTVGGGYTVSQDLHLPGGIQVYDGSNWEVYQDDINSILGDGYFEDINAIDVDPRDANHVFVSGRTGIYEFSDRRFVRHYSYDNSALSPTYPDDKMYVVVHDVKFDAGGNLWALNSINKEKNIIRLGTDGQWISLYKEPLKSLTNLRNITFDSRSLMWFVNDSWKKTGLFCYQPSSDAINSYTSFINQDGTTVNVEYVHCVAEDKDHHMWIGTNVGPLRLSPSEITSQSPVFEQVKVPRNDGTNYADYLLDGVNISCIVIDGGGRKWMGTYGNGIYLISADCMTQIAHFTETNSKLLSDNILAMAINPATGEVFIGTDKGLCSYSSGATEPVDEMNKDNTYAYPNPVNPDYTGPITIVGLSYNADVKIVTASGTLVAQGRSNGGTFEWNGCDLKGRRVASGVYMVQTATADGSKGTVCKIAVVN